MEVNELWKLFRPRAEEQEPGFRREIERLSRRTLIALGWVEIALTMVVIVCKAFGVPYPHDGPLKVWPVMACFSQGALLLWIARSPWGARHGRVIALCSGLFTTVLLSAFQIDAAQDALTLTRRGTIDMLTIMLVGVAVIPARPFQMLLFTLAATATQLGIFHLAFSQQWVAGSTEIGGQSYADFLILSLLCTALSAINYQRIFATWMAHQQALKAAESTRQAEARALMAESVASMGRLAAAVSHELNTPLGSLKSSVGGLLTALIRFTAAGADQKERIRPIMDQFGKSTLEAAARLETIIQRMQRFTNLDRADVQDVNLNEVIQDVISLIRSDTGAVPPIRLELDQVPPVRCQPQPLNAVLANIVHRAVERTAPGEQVVLLTRKTADKVEVDVRESRALTESETRSLFDPKFRVTAGRVGTGNWTLFHARQILTEQGAEIVVDTSDPNCVTYRLFLPVTAQVPAQASAARR